MDIQKQISKEIKRGIKKYKKSLDAAKKLETRMIYLMKKRTTISGKQKGGADMSHEIKKVEKIDNDDKSELAITNIKKSPYLTRQGKKMAKNIINDTMLHEARKRSDRHVNKVEVETVVDKGQKKIEGIMEITTIHSDFKEKLKEQIKSPEVLKKTDTIFDEIHEEAINKIKNMR